MARPEPDDDAPWLSGVEATRDTTYVPQRRLIGGALLFLALLGVILGGLYWVTARARQGGSSGTAVRSPEEAPLIAADPGPYKVPPDADAPTGLKVDGAGNTIYAAGAGQTVTGALDPGAMPEEPLARPGAPGAAPTDLLPTEAGGSATAAIPPAGAKARPVAETPKPAPAPPVKLADATPTPLKPLPKPAPVEAGKPVKTASGSGALQLGAFSSSAKADSVWADYAKRFKYLAGLGKSVQSVERDGTTLYRLRATGVADAAAAADLCARLKIAGVECVVAK